MRVVLTGGGTGGHLVPFEPMVDALRAVFAERKDSLPGWVDNSKLDLYFLGVADQETRKFFDRLGVKTTHIPAAKLRRYPSARTLTDVLFRLPLGAAMALVYMWKIMPDVVVSKGGYGSVPVGIAAAFYRVPVLLHESDVVFGLANRFLAVLASAITVGFEDTRRRMVSYKSKTVVTGTPVREELRPVEAAEAKKQFGFSPEDKVLLVMGGSQGSEEINKVLLEALPKLISGMGIIHLTGKDNFEKVKEEAGKKLAGSNRHEYYRPFSYLSTRLVPAMSAADVVISRAGATSLAELTRLRKAAILIPLDSAAQNHQRRNATQYEKAGAARVIDPANLGPALLLQNVKDLMENEQITSTLKANMEQLDYETASRSIAELAFKLASGKAPRQPKKEKAPA